jgi:hypothetical protein
MGKIRRSAILLSTALSSCALFAATLLHAETTSPLPGHVLPKLGAATRIATPSTTAPLTLTIVMRRDDEAGYAEYLREVYDPQSTQFHKFLTAAQQSERFGPSQQSVDAVLGFLAGNRLQVTSTSPDRLIVGATATREDTERAFNIRVNDYTLGGHAFFANDAEPNLPADIAPRVSAVLGLSDLAHSQRSGALAQYRDNPPFGNGVNEDELNKVLPYSCRLADTLDQADSISTLIDLVGSHTIGLSGISPIVTLYRYKCAADVLDMVAEFAGNAGGTAGETSVIETPSIAVESGSGQKVGLVEFDVYESQDVLNFLTLIGHPERISQLSDVTLGAGANFNASAEAEVLLDIDTVMSLAPGADVTEYDMGFAGQGSFQTVFNRMIADGMDVISNSFAYCEDQTTLSDVQSLESVLQTAKMAGITVVTGSGDSGSTCLDGAANTVAVPASSPSITAVGGTTAIPSFDGTYGSETWWDGTSEDPSSGQGGFGVSRFFTRPAYQNGFTAQTMRSVPDVTAPANPTQGVIICQADAGGCPTPYYYGGTSVAAPTWASLVAVMNQRAGNDVGFLNQQIYPLSTTTAFHSATSMQSDFAHVGLGSPNAAELRRHLASASVGAVNTSNSAIDAYPPNAYADGTQIIGVTVVLFDANFAIVAGQSVTVTANSGSHATITAVNSVSDTNNGAARFSVTDLTAETVTLTAHVGGSAISRTVSLNFAGALAASGNVATSPATQTADGQSTSTVTVTLEDASSRPAAGKQVLLAQNGNSIILGANPATTDASGQATFEVTDQVQETVTYNAVDQTDFNLAVPVTATVTFVDGPGGGCGSGPVPQAGAGYALSVYASGFPVQNELTYGGVTIHGCDGVSGIAFDEAGNLFASDYVTGDVYKFAPGGGVADATTRLTPASLGPSLSGLTFGIDHKLYATRVATSPTATTGAILKIDPATGASTTFASGLSCPSAMATDPLHGDFFVADFCYGTTQQSASIIRVPANAAPFSTYADSSGSPNGSVNFSPDGTLYVVYSYVNFPGIDAISGTNGPAVPTVAQTGVSSSFATLPIGTNPNAGGGAKTLIVGAQSIGGYAHSVAAIDMTASPPTYNGATLVQSDIGSVKLLGPDQCVYFANNNAVYKLTNADSTCPLNNIAADDYAVLTPESTIPTAPQGTVQRFDIRFPHHLGLARGSLPIIVQVNGANSTMQSIVNGFNDLTTFSYSGILTGTDTITATATIGGTTLTSNAVTATWTTGKHTTFIDLNNTATSATLGVSTLISASLIDESVSPQAPIAGETLEFTVAGQTCSATTGANGVASCYVAVAATTDCTLTATFAGDANFAATTNSSTFFVSKFDVLFANGFESVNPAGCVAY